MASLEATSPAPRQIRRRQAETVEEALLRLLEGPEGRPGARLPTERALAERLGVPRSAVRAALSRLEAHGRIVRIIGSGTYVAEQAPAPAAPPPAPGRDASPQEIMETRAMIEPKLVLLVIAHANAADLERIEEAMRRAEAATSFEEFELWDGRFHEAIAEATHNRLMIEIYRTVTAARDLTEWGELKRRSVTEARRAGYHHEHREIVAAIRARDAPRAEAALADHLASVRRNLFGF